MSLRRGKTDKAKKKRPGIHEITVENDMRYRGPFNYVHFKIFGWLCMVFSQIALFIRLAGNIDEGAVKKGSFLTSFLDGMATLALPFLLIAVFAQLLNNAEGYKRQLIINGAATAGISLLYYLIFYRYIVGGVAVFLDPPSQAVPAMTSLLSKATPYGFVAFNIFVDLFLCTLTMLFLNYTPKRIFRGKLCILFRLMALLPVAYEVGCMVLKVRAARGLIQVPLWTYPLLTVKPPMTFVLFIFLTLYVKRREHHFRKHGKTHKDFKAFLKTRRNSWNFSVFLAIMMVVVSVIDFGVVLGFSLYEAAGTISSQVKAADVVAESAAGTEMSETSQAETAAAVTESGAEAGMPAASQAGSAAAVTEPGTEAGLSGVVEPESVELIPETESPPQENISAESVSSDTLDDMELMASLNTGIHIAEAVGFGDSIALIFLAPLVLLFSYTREPKNPLLNIIIPAVGAVLIFFVYLEGIHQLLGILPIERVNLNELEDMITVFGGMM